MPILLGWCGVVLAKIELYGVLAKYQSCFLVCFNACRMCICHAYYRHRMTEYESVTYRMSCQFMKFIKRELIAMLIILQWFYHSAVAEKGQNTKHDLFIFLTKQFVMLLTTGSKNFSKKGRSMWKLEYYRILKMMS